MLLLRKRDRKMWRLNNIMALFFLCFVTSVVAMRDPTRPPTEQLAAMGGKEDKRFAVSSILHAVNRQHVVINGQVLREGDVINGVKVVKIEDDRVQLMDGAMVIEIPIYKRVKEPVAADMEKKQ